MIIRPVAMTDLAALQAIAVESGPGFTSLVADEEFLRHKIQRSIASFGALEERPGNHHYLFVLTEPATGEIIGTTGIEASVGSQQPLYHFRLGQRGRRQTLTLSQHYSGCSELCTLFLRPQFRRPWAGKLLSRVRLLFMAQHPQRFASTVIAEMRGVSDQAGDAPFWNWLRANAIDLDFAAASRRVALGDSGFISQLIPAQGIYTQLMDDAARSVIAQVHPDTRPALAMLEAEGFRFNGLIDPLDGGPTVEARVKDLPSVRQSQSCRIRIRQRQAPELPAWTNAGQGKTLLIANHKTADFRATVTSAARYLPAQRRLEVPEHLVQDLGLEDHSEICFTELGAGRGGRQALSASSPFMAVKEAVGAR